MRDMDLVVAVTRPWHFWIGAVMIFGALLLVLAIVVGYLVRVAAAKYPRA